MTTSPKPMKPTHVGKMPRKHGPWQECGMAWATNNGGFNVQLFAFPVDGRIVFVPSEK